MVSSQQENDGAKPPVVNISYDELLKPGGDLLDKIQKAYGKDGLGILTVSGVPDFVPLRQRLLPLAEAIPALPAEVLRGFEDASSSFSVGWSAGKEALASGAPDTYKGSFYANPLHDEPPAPPGAAQAFPSYYRPNVWPRQLLPELEGAFKELGRLMMAVGLRLVEHCDRYVASQGSSMTPGKLTSVLQASTVTKGRLLHYFPPSDHMPSSSIAFPPPDPPSGSSTATVAPSHEVWCGWHTDHGSLTGLTCAMFLRAGEEVPCPDPESGLYIKDRRGNVLSVAIPPDCIAYQMGEAMQVHSGGELRATPHCVRAPAAGTATGISRNTLAVFMQPDALQELDAPPGVPPEHVALGEWQPGIAFGEFADRTLQRYYSTNLLKAPEQQQQQQEQQQPPTPREAGVPRSCKTAAV